MSPRALRLAVTLCALALVACDDGSTADPASDRALPDAAAADGSPLDGAIEPGDDAAPDHDAADAAPPADRGLDAGPDLDATPDADASTDPDPDAADPDPAPDPDQGPPPPPLDPPIITEIMAANAGALLDDDGDPSDWIELHNPNPHPYPLAGHHLSDDPADPTRWRLPAIDIPPRGYLVVFASDKDRDDPRAPLHTDFRLDADREAVTLADPDGAVLDTLGPWPPQFEAASYGRPMTLDRRPLIAPETPARHAPLTALTPDWSDPAFPDADWPEGPLPIGFDPQEALATPLPDHAPGEGRLIRLAFTVPDDLPPAALTLEVHADDGFAAWLDGAPIGADNAPPFLVPEATAPADHPADAPPRVIALPPFAPGPHLLAVAALDAAADDRRFTLALTLDAVTAAIDPGAGYLTPTPGAPNHPAPELPPVIFELTRDPAVHPDEPIEVTARVIAPSAPLTAVRLTWRRRFAPEETLDMAPDAIDSTLYRATLPGAPAGELIRWYAQATDAAERTTREPPYPDPTDSEQYRGAVVIDEAIITALPVLHWFVEDPAGADRDGGARSTLWYQGALYDNVRADIHGQSTRGFPKKSYDLDFTRDNRFELDAALPRMKDINLLSTWADKSRVRNTLAYEVFRDAGHDHHLAFPMRVQRNGGFFSIADFVEDADDRWLERMAYPEPIGALYKMYDRVENAASAEKKTRTDEGIDDLRAVVDALRLPPAERRAWLFDNIDLARTANYLAANFVIGNVDCCHKNYYLYRDTDGTAEWWFMPWDVDLSFGRVWTGSYFDDRLYPDTGLFLGRDTGSRNVLLAALYEQPEFVAMYLRRTRSLLDALLQPPGTPDPHLEARIAALEAQLAPDAATDTAAWPTWGEPQTMPEAIEHLRRYLADRRAHVYGTLVEREAGAVFIDATPGEATARYRVPLADDPTLAWTAPDFDDTEWLEGPLGLGYENAPAEYAPFIATPVRPTDADPRATSIQLRVPFTVDDPDAIEAPILSMRYDDGYVAWINGVEVARRNVDGLPSWDAIAALHDDNRAIAFEGVALDPAVLRPGENLLAIQIVNNGAQSSDLLIQPALSDGLPGAGVLPPAQAADLTLTIAATEVAADPAESWVALHNPGDRAIDLSGWTLEGGGIAHAFTPGTVIPADGTLHIVADARRFRAREASPRGGEAHFVQGNWRGRLDDRLAPPRLRDPAGRLLDPR